MENVHQMVMFSSVLALGIAISMINNPGNVYFKCKR